MAEVDSNEIYIIDAAAYLAHSEKEIRIWRFGHHLMKSKESMEQ